MKPYRRLIDSLAGSRGFAWFGRTLVAPIDKRVGDRIPLLAGTGLPVLRLETTGRRSGQPRTSVLLYVTMPSGDLAVAGTNFGADQAPAWTYNLDAHPIGTLRIDGSAPEPVTGRRATDAEISDIWDALDDVWPAFSVYRSRTDRDIGVYLLQSNKS